MVTERIMNKRTYRRNFPISILTVIEQGLETGHRTTACHAIKARDTVFVFKSAYNPGSEECKVRIRLHLKLGLIQTHFCWSNQM